MPGFKGDYVLVVEVRKAKKILIGSLGKIEFKRGLYLYVGSAQNGLEQRIERHLRNEKKIFWHIDYLLSNPSVQIREVWIKEGKKGECKLARNFLKNKDLKVIKGFGSSDCSCPGHLFYAKGNRIIRFLKALGLKKYNC